MKPLPVAHNSSHPSPSRLVARKWIIIPALAATVFGFSGSLQATAFDKGNNTIALSTNGSYTTTGVPGTSDTILISSTMGATKNVALGGNMSIDGILFDTTATGSLSIGSSANTLTIGASGITMNTPTTVGLSTNTNIALSANQTWSLGTRSVTIGGSATIAENGFLATITGTNQLSFNSSAAQSLAAKIDVTTLTVAGATTGLTLTNTNNSFTAMAISVGGTVIGSTMSKASGNSTLGKGAITIGGSTSNGTLKYSGVTDSYNQAVQHDARAAVSTLEVITTGETLTLTSNLITTNIANSAVGNGWALGGAGNLALSGVVSDSSNVTRTGTTLNKIGAGTVKLSGNNTYTGGTTVTTGTLLVNTTQTAANSGTGTGNVTVTAGTLGGVGILRPGTGNNVTVNSGAFLAPGDSTAVNTLGTLVLDAGGTGTALLTMSSGSKFSFDLGTGVTSDKLNFWNYTTGDFAISANAVDFTLDASVTSGSRTFNLFNFYTNNGAALTTDTFTGLTFGTLSSNIGAHSFDYTTPGQINLTITAVPEPATWALLAFSLTALAVLRRRRLD